MSILIILKLSYDLGQRFNTDNELIYFLKHLIICGIGWILLYFTSKQSHGKLIWYFEIFYYLALCLTFGTAIFGRKINGVRRWISLGFFSLQSSEFIKVFLPFIISQKLVEENHNQVIFYLLISCASCLVQPDLGMTILISISAGSQILFHGKHLKKYFIIGGIILALLGSVLIFYATYAHNRFSIFFGKKAGFQISQSLKAVANSFFIGENIGIYIPDSHCDFIFSAICNGLGSFPCYIIILLPVFVLMSILKSTHEIKYHNNLSFYKRVEFIPKYEYRICLIIISLVFQFAFQTYFHVLSNLALVPTKGVTLPLVSYGGSSIFAYMILFGFVLSITKRNLLVR